MKVGGMYCTSIQVSIYVDNGCTPLLCCAVYVDRVGGRDGYGGVRMTVNRQRKGFVVIIGLGSLKRDVCYLW
jgi:hypothetical protein